MNDKKQAQKKDAFLCAYSIISSPALSKDEFRGSWNCMFDCFISIETVLMSDFNAHDMILR